VNDVKRCALWMRVSTTSQHTGNQDLALRERAGLRGFEVTAEYVLEESAFTGKHRAVLAEAVAAAKAGEFSVIMVWALDRLSREGPERMLSAVRQFNEAGCAVVSVEEPWTEVSGDMLELLLSIAGWVAGMESRRRSERVKAGLARRAREDPSFRPGRQQGATDKADRPRRRSGYVAAWEPGGARRERQNRGAA
jgi:DNA invertase Pin-like site-specific DNA recombinase